MNQTPKYLKPYAFHGVAFENNGEEAIGDCPFCLKESHFGIKTTTGQFRCVRCDESGNVASFLQKLHHYSYQQTEDSDLKELAQNRNLKIETLRAYQVAKSIVTGDYLLPVFNPRGKLANLFKLVETDGKYVAYATATCKIHPFGTHLVNKRHKILYICEGPWDGMRLYEALQSVRKTGTSYVLTRNPKLSLAATAAVIAVPGASHFDQDWAVYGKDRTVYLLYDNDWPKKAKSGSTIQPGWDGMQKAIKILQESSSPPKKIKYLQWGKKGYTKNLPNGFDIRDWFTAEGTIKTLKGIDYLLKSPKKSIPSKPEPEEKQRTTVEPIDCQSFTDLCNGFGSCLHFTQQLKDTLAVMLAVVASTELQGDQLWLRVIGPPGSGKSTLAESISAAREYIFSVSLQTGFHSGYTGGGKNKNKDASLIPKMNHKTVIIKDGDTLLTAPNRDRILAELRDIYDGTSRAVYRNRVTRIYEKLRITFVVCGTDEMRGLNRSFLGERFLDCEILGTEETQPYLDRAIDNTYSQILGSINPSPKEETEDSPRSTYLKGITYGFISHLKSKLENGEIQPPTLPDTIRDKIRDLGEFLSYMRARVKRNGTELAYRPRVELGTRLASQLTKLAVCLAIVLGKPSIDNEVLRIVRKVAFDTAEGFQFEITKALAKSPGMSAHQISLEISLSETTVRRLLSDMAELHIVQRYSIPNNSGIRGRNRHLWQLVPAIQSLYNRNFSTSKRKVKA